MERKTEAVELLTLMALAIQPGLIIDDEMADMFTATLMRIKKALQSAKED